MQNNIITFLMKVIEMYSNWFK